MDRGAWLEVDAECAWCFKDIIIPIPEPGEPPRHIYWRKGTDFIYCDAECSLNHHQVNYKTNK